MSKSKDHADHCPNTHDGRHKIQPIIYREAGRVQMFPKCIACGYKPTAADLTGQK